MLRAPSWVWLHIVSWSSLELAIRFLSTYFRHPVGSVPVWSRHFVVTSRNLNLSDADSYESSLRAAMSMDPRPTPCFPLSRIARERERGPVTSIIESPKCSQFFCVLSLRSAVSLRPKCVARTSTKHRLFPWRAVRWKSLYILMNEAFKNEIRLNCFLSNECLQHARI